MDVDFLVPVLLSYLWMFFRAHCWTHLSAEVLL